MYDCMTARWDISQALQFRKTFSYNCLLLPPLPACQIKWRKVLILNTSSTY
jgi:hypothetical protein